jgi:Pyruvate/2-oxoacid:ferredoxin oxidoreductase delta subunit
MWVENVLVEKISIAVLNGHNHEKYQRDQQKNSNYSYCITCSWCEVKCSEDAVMVLNSSRDGVYLKW